ncbi:MAG: homoserine/homoserine lactone efflux protein [Saprospiraceae bacterium]|jgi:homoserine/homoserine lactone efflux protein
MLEATIQFLLITVFLEVAPGPGVLFVVFQSSFGFRNCAAAIAGLLTANLIWLTLVATGLGLVISQSAVAFEVMRWCGATYLGYLGIKIILNGLGQPRVAKSGKKTHHFQTYFKGVFVSLSNPKALIFFLALFPNFARPEFFMHDMVYFGALKMICLTVVMSSYGFMGKRIFKYLRNSKAGDYISKALGIGIILAAIAIVRH